MSTKTCIISIITTLIVIVGVLYLYAQVKTPAKLHRDLTVQKIHPSHKQRATSPIKKKTKVQFSYQSSTKKRTPPRSSSTILETPEEFYQFIIDNNIFRPLGWHSPKKQPAYTLIGTAVAKDIAYTKAFILEQRSNRLNIVKVGDSLGNARVEKIQSKQVTLHEKGKNIILRGGRLQFF